MWLAFPLGQWMGLVSVTVATLLTIGWWERGRWTLGLAVPPVLATRELLHGALFGAALIAGCALAVVLSTSVRHVPGGDFPWRELVAIYLPAVVHEELLFRGYAFQKLFAWRPRFAILFGAVLFAALHLGNPSVTLLGIGNILLGGILLGLAYARYGRLWFPIGLHLAWNLMTGPVLGHEVSGYEGATTLLVEVGSGPWWLTGGDFGIEGSVWMTVAEVAGIVLLAPRMKNEEVRMKNGEGAEGEFFIRNS
ncbi:MAG TPA: CPBP family intramembrane glutamic endopeptidase [Thermoanaerobaculia bacterium]